MFVAGRLFAALSVSKSFIHLYNFWSTTLFLPALFLLLNVREKYVGSINVNDI